MLYINSKENIENYRNYPAINQSYLKHIDNVYFYNSLIAEKKTELFFEEKDYFTIGSGVDKMLTDKDNFNDEFYISKLSTKPSDKIKSIIQQIVSELNIEDKTNIKLLDFRDLIIKVCKDQKFQSTYKDDTLVNTVVKDGEDYFIELLNSENKTILSMEEHNLILIIVNNILQNNTIKKLFNYEESFADVIFQHDIYFNINGINCKGLLDMVHINHVTQTITPIDIKTMGDYTLNFEQNFWKRRYDFQAAFYRDGLILDIERLGLKIGKDLSNYTVTNFHFIVESTTAPGNPILFEISDETINVGRNGKVTEWSNKWGYYRCIDEYKWYSEYGFTKQRILVEFDDYLTI